MKKLLTLSLLLTGALTLRAQDSIRARLIFIGDAGKISAEQRVIIADAANKIIPGKSTAVYLGNNIFPKGMSEDDTKGQEILKAQFQPLRQKGAAVYFIPGNRDWNNSGPDGLVALKREGQYLARQNDSLLKLLPASGCPDPVAISVSDSLTIIFMDSEWWLFPLNKDNPGAECGCSSERDITASLRQLLYQNRYKTILLAIHHPLKSYGTHGGRFSWKENIFPLTDIQKDLYWPLPIAGSLYPLFKKAFPGHEDLQHPVYKDLIKNINQVFRGYPNLIIVSAHDNGAQLIEDSLDEHTQIVTGIGHTPAFNKKGKYSLFHTHQPGYVTADWLSGNKIHFRFYAYQNDTVKEVYDYTRDYQPFSNWKDEVFSPITTDSIKIAAHPEYDRPGKFARLWTGENYRKAWAAPVELPVIRLSEINGGLWPVKLGGGFQSTSLRLADAAGKEYNLRSVNKTPDKVVPQPFRGTFVRELLDDATSAQHPYSALMVPPVADAVGVPVARPVIGVVAPDTALGAYEKLFAGKINLLEAREPLGNTDNSVKAMKKLQDDNDNSYDALNFMKARMIDLLFADWDRHGDQWRFYDEQKGKHKYYIAIPRDRDMVLNVTEGVLPFLLKHFFVMPRVYGFRKNLLPGSNYYLYKSSFLNAHPASQINYSLWMATAQAFQDSLTDAVLKKSVATLPRGLDIAKETQILNDLEARRDNIPEAMDKYYRFSNRIVDIHLSDKNEFVNILPASTGNGIQIIIRKIGKRGHIEDTIANKIYLQKWTKEIRLYLAKGQDSVQINNPSGIRLRLIGGKGAKSYLVLNSRKRIRIYDHKPEDYYGQTGKIKKHIRSDSANTAFVPVNLYNTFMPLVTGAINADDGILLGLGIQFTQQHSFRKTPYKAIHKLTLAHSFSTNAYNLKYKGTWRQVAGKADLMVTGDIKAPENTQNFYGVGNETPFYKTEGYKRFYRTRFNLFTLATALRWQDEKGSRFSIGPIAQYYRMDATDNTGRFIEETAMFHSFDSAVINKEKWHLGLMAEYELDRRNNHVLPTYGQYTDVRISGYTGLNHYSRSFVQMSAEWAFYKNLNDKQSVVLSDRIGGTATLGHPAFYQYAYLGGQGNLLGYRKYRFAGLQAVYNNLELRVALADFGNYILKGQIGLNGFYDIGRVWRPGENSQKWHQGLGGGIYFAPAGLAVFRFDLGYSPEGWYPYFTFGFRF